MRAATALLAAAVMAVTVVISLLLLLVLVLLPVPMCDSSRGQWFTGLALLSRLLLLLWLVVLAISTGKRFSEMAVETAVDVDEGNDAAAD